MLDIAALEAGFGLLFDDFSPWLVVVPGLLIGMVFGAVPGLQISMAMAIFLPLTLYLDFMRAMLFLTSIFTGGSFGGGVPAILMNIPGTSSAMATTFDGYPMSRRGEHNQALGLALGASCIGVIISYGVLLFLVRPVSELVLLMGPAEMAVVILWGITLIASLSGEHLLKGLIAGGFGLLIGTIGFSEAGVSRGTLGLAYLLDGIPVIPAMMGMFAASELIRLARRSHLVENEQARRVSMRRIASGFLRAVTYPRVILRGSMIGIFIGAVPGIGSSIANLLSWISTRNGHPEPDTFGNGQPAGVVAAEAANSTSEAGSMATLLALGVPGGGATAVMLAAFALHNITGGPQFIREQTDVVYAIILANFGQAFLLIVFGLMVVPVLANVVKAPMPYLVPSVLALATFGAFGLVGNLSGPMTVMVFAIVGWLFKRFDYSVPATVTGMLLGSMADESMIYSYQISGGQWSYLLERPAVLVMLVLLLASLFGGKFVALLKRRAARGV